MMPANPILSLTKTDFTIEWFSGTGAGGQHRNKHQNCCRITHTASGVSTQGSRHKSRVANQREAFRALAVRLRPWIKREVGIQETPRADELNGFGGKYVRTYNEPDNRVVDHRTGDRIPYRDFEKNIDRLILATERDQTNETRS